MFSRGIKQEHWEKWVKKLKINFSYLKNFNDSKVANSLTDD